MRRKREQKELRSMIEVKANTTTSFTEVGEDKAMMDTGKKKKPCSPRSEEVREVEVNSLSKRKLKLERTLI